MGHDLFIYLFVCLQDGGIDDFIVRTIVPPLLRSSSDLYGISLLMYARFFWIIVMGVFVICPECCGCMNKLL